MAANRFCRRIRLFDRFYVDFIRKLRRARLGEPVARCGVVFAEFLDFRRLFVI